MTVERSPTHQAPQWVYRSGAVLGLPYLLIVPATTRLAVDAPAWRWRRSCRGRHSTATMHGQNVFPPLKPPSDAQLSQGHVGLGSVVG